MVLADLSPPDSLGNDTYTSTPSNDPLTGPLFHYDPNSLPIVFPVLGPLLGFTHARKLAHVDAELTKFAQQIARPLTPTESQILASATATKVTYPSWVEPPLLAFALRRHLALERAKGEFSLVFMNAKVEQCTPAKFGMRETPLLRALFASARVAPTTFAWLVGARFIASTMHVSAFAQTVLNNTELDGLRKALRRAQGEMRGGQGQGERSQGVFGGRMAGGDAPRRTAGDEGGSTAGWGDAAPPRDDPRPGDEVYNAKNDTAWGMGSSSNDVDDASPTAGAPPESSWERIRRETQAEQQGGRRGGTPGPPRWARRPQGGENNERNGDDGDMFGFSRAEEEAQLAKGEAQRDFDTRMERERQGKDF
ncbi:hypothetical protein P152DRAFT_510414 [Eremomyces bilateralis CBS 781.70]|uniref:Uncharacterized protein n=1 Tax=Eremomyces bilateralis CBS 781.70 TaxID=1392243 RepID=A0A6G1GG86_9PEZI|nr:uncharacterized protein P152DRAFT_510414 [Eremomyces bilateralis CBS 781.70]KAF1817115.1 hypothetical protein P152DRAFT_510414 [Eremomyces bilateralis CBS 781.70]